MRVVDEKLLGVSEIPEGYYVTVRYGSPWSPHESRFHAGQGWKKDRLCADLEAAGQKYSQRIYMVA